MGIKKTIAAALAFFCLLGKGAVGKQETKPENDRFVYDHVIVIGIDGAGNFHRKCNTPNMDKIFIEDGAWTDHCRAATPSISAQCWGSMLTGVKPSVHRLTNDIVGSREYKNEAYPTFFTLVRKAHPKAELGAFCNWSPISRGIVEQNINVTVEGGEDDVLTEKICSYIKDKKPELLFIQFDSVDHAGHSVNYGSDKYFKVLEIVDTYIGKIHDAIEDAGIEDSTLLMITADHGGIGTSHGGATEAEMNVFFGAHGKSINKTDKLTTCGRDLAAIVCYALNVEGNEAWDSYVPQEMFLDNMNPPTRPVDEYKEYVTRPTPAAGTDKSIENFIDMSHLRAGLFFDDQLADLAGKEKVETVGTVYYPEGFYGKALRVSSEGYLSFPNMTFGEDSFSISFWIKVDDGVNGDPAIFSNKDWENGKSKGFIFAYTGATKFNVGNVAIRDDFDYADPETLTNWSHITVVVDREEGKVTTYANFKQVACDELKKGFKGFEFDAGYPLNFGQDGSGEYPCSISAEFDDILIFDNALSSADVANLKAYYAN